MNEERASCVMAIETSDPLERSNYNFQPSLLSRATNAVVIALWYHDRVLSQSKFGVRVIEEENINKHIKTFAIPKSLRILLLQSIRPVREQIKQWQSINGHLLSGNANRYKHLVWTSKGLINFSATANNLIQNGRLKPVDAFKLACVNCIVPHIFEIWPTVQKHFETINLPDNFDFLPDETIIRWARHQYILEPEVLFWVNYLKRGSQIPDRLVDEPFFQKAYLRSFYEGNLSALSYFFEQTDYCKDIKSFIETADIMKTLNKHNKIAILLFLLSYMDNELKDQFLKSDPENILLCFLEWPLNEFFLQVTDKVLMQLGVEGFSKVSQATIQKILQYENEVVPYRNLFVGLWQRTPSALKTPCLQEWIDAILTKLFLPKSPNDALAILSCGTWDLEKLCGSLLHEAETVLHVFIEENKHRAFKSLLKNLVSSDAASVKKFESAYEKCTEKYLKMYYFM